MKNYLKNQMSLRDAIICIIVFAGMLGWAYLMYVVMQSR